jgi:membrane associated rhomboid family serine protease
MPLLDALIIIFLVIVSIVQLVFFWLPIGNEQSLVRRLPMITFGIIGLNVLIFVGTLFPVHGQEQELMEKYQEIVEILERNPDLLADKDVKQRLVDAHIARPKESDDDEPETRDVAERDEAIPEWLRGLHRPDDRIRLNEKLDEFREIAESGVHFRFGIAPNGSWKIHQLLSHMFIHGDIFHLLGNMFFFFAVGFTLEDLWGRGLFATFYFAGGLAACLPVIIFPNDAVMFGASGAVSAVMGAFLVRLPKTKIRIGWAFTPHLFFYLVWMRFRRLFDILALLGGFKIADAIKSTLVYFTVAPYIDIYNLIIRRSLNIAAYIFLPYYFIVQVASLWWEKKSGQPSGIAFSVHIAGFVFGALFAFILKASKVEEKYIHQRIEEKITFTASSAVTESLDLIDKGDVALAERKLQAQLLKNPEDVNAIMSLAQLYKKTENYEQLNNMTSRLIRYYLSHGDKEAALYAYDGLLSSFPDNAVNPKIYVRDWMTICEYLREMEMVREASVEYERIVKAYPDDPLALRACLQGGEAALLVNDKERAVRLFEHAMTMNPTGSYRMRLERGLAGCTGYALPPAR